jgi:hypothetical protein
LENNSVPALSEAIKNIFALSDERLHEKGAEAKKYVNEQKNAVIQSRRILDFLEK